MTAPIEMQVEPQNEYQYRVRYEAWHYRKSRDDGSDEGGYDLDRELIVRLQGSDRELAHAPLGIVAATPLLNPKPVTSSTYD